MDGLKDLNHKRIPDKGRIEKIDHKLNIHNNFSIRRHSVGESYQFSNIIMFCEDQYQSFMSTLST